MDVLFEESFKTLNAIHIHHAVQKLLLHFPNVNLESLLCCNILNNPLLESILWAKHFQTSFRRSRIDNFKEASSDFGTLNGSHEFTPPLPMQVKPISIYKAINF